MLCSVVLCVVSVCVLVCVCVCVWLHSLVCVCVCVCLSASVFVSVFVGVVVIVDEIVALEDFASEVGVGGEDAGVDDGDDAVGCAC